MAHLKRILFFIIFWYPSIHALPNANYSKYVLLGTIKCNNIHNFVTRIYYKGNAYEARLNKKEAPKEINKINFQLFDDEKIAELYVLITEKIIPTNATINNFTTSTDYHYRYFKLTKKTSFNPDNPEQLIQNNNEKIALYYSWLIEEQDNSTILSIPMEKTIWLCMDSSIIDSLETTAWKGESNILQLPIIKLCTDISAETVLKMQCARMDFDFFHKKALPITMPFAQNRIISMPFSSTT